MQSMTSHKHVTVRSFQRARAPAALRGQMGKELRQSSPSFHLIIAMKQSERAPQHAVDDRSQACDSVEFPEGTRTGRASGTNGEGIAPVVAFVPFDNRYETK